MPHSRVEIRWPTLARLSDLSRSRIVVVSHSASCLCLCANPLCGMGSGVSKPSARHSDSRVDEVRSELVKEAHAHVHGSSTLTLTLSLQEYANSLRSSAESSKSKSKKRAHSLPTANNTGPRSGGVWGKLGGHAASSVVQTTGSSEEMQEEVDVHDSVAPVQRTASATATTEEGEEEDEEYYEDDFEDEIVDWKKGDSIGSGSYGTVRKS